MAGEDIGYYALPVLLSFEGIDKQVNSALGNKLQAAGLKGGKDFGQGLASGVRSGEADVKRAMDNYSKLFDKAADATGKLKTAEAGLEDLRSKGITSGQRYVRATEAVEKARRDEARATKSATDALKDYERAAKSAASAGDDVASGLLGKLKGAGGQASSAGSEAASGFVEGFGGPIAAIGTKGGPIGLALAAAAILGTGAGVAIGQQVMAGLEREVQGDKIAAQLGLDEAQAAQVARSTGKVYADNFGESFGDVNQAMADVISSFRDASPEVVEDLTAKAVTFRDIFGTEVPQTIANAQQLIENGLAKDGAEAFDLLTTAFQKVPAAMRDELPDLLEEYGTNFQSMGFSGEEAIAMIIAAAPRGKIVLDKLGDSMKEFSLLATDLGNKNVQDTLTGLGFNGADVANNVLAGGDTAQDQLQAIVDKLQAIPDAGKQAEAAVALFGTPLEDLDKAKIPDFLDSLDDLDTALLNVDGSADRMLDTVGNNAAASIESAKRSIEQSLAGMQDSLAQVFGPEIQRFADWVRANGPEIEGFFVKLGQAAIGAAGLVVDFAGDAMIALSDLVGGVGNVYGGILRAGAALQRLTGDTETADEWDRQADAAFGWGESLEKTGEDLKGYKTHLDGVNARLEQNHQDTQTSAKLTDALGDSIVKLPDGKTLTIEDNTPETRAKLEALGFEVKELPDGQIQIIPKTEEATRQVEAWRRLQENQTFKLMPALDFQQANTDLTNWLGQGFQVPVTVQPNANGPLVGGGAAPKFAKGRNGTVSGPGTGTSDSILAWLSNGEGVVKESAMRNGGAPLVTALNAGWSPSAEDLHRMFPGIPGFAEGLNPGADFLRSQIMNMWPQIGTIGGRRSEDGYGEHSSGNAMDIMIPDYSTPEGKALGDAVASFLVQNKDAIDLNGMIWRQTSYGYGGGWSGKTMGDRGNDTQNHFDHIHAILGEGRGQGAPAVDLPTTSLSMPGGGSFSPTGDYSTLSGGGGGTPGYNEDGEPGTYVQDPKKLRQAQQAIADADERVRRADQDVAEAELKRKELDADASESQRLAADNALANAKADAEKARREAQDARADAQEAQRGDFQKAKDSTSGSGKSGGTDQFGELGSIASSFLQETFGIDGSFLPDLSNLMPVKMASTLLNAFSGWGQDEDDLSTSPSTSNAPFGMPNVAVPGPPDGQAHLSGPGGAPAAPGPNITIDQSQNFNNSPLGWDPARVEKERQRTQNQRTVPRLSGIPMGAGN